MRGNFYSDNPWTESEFIIPDKTLLSKSECWILDQQTLQHWAVRHQFVGYVRPRMEYRYLMNEEERSLNLKDIFINNFDTQEILAKIDIKKHVPSLPPSIYKDIITQNKSNMEMTFQKRFFNTFKKGIKKGVNTNFKIYQKFALDIYHCKIDFLSVFYKKSFFGKIKRNKIPPTPLNQFEHQNIKDVSQPIGVFQPIGTFHYWKYVPEKEDNISKSNSLLLKNPYEIEFLPHQQPKFRFYLTGYISPTLYELSNYAFPLKGKSGFS